MIPLLLCGGFKMSTIIFLSPVFFSLAHLNHLFELQQQGCNFMRSLLIVGIFLYTFFPLLPSCIDMRIKLLSYISFVLVSESQNRLLDLY